MCNKLKNESDEGYLALPYKKIKIKATLSKMIRDLHRKRQIKFASEIDQNLYGNLVYDKGGISSYCRKDILFNF